ncbi:odorant receptor 131-2-like [Larimichthys crocea]|uniref:odorant receptor 131-2-like n=1 Tax=Larimichthys crocea TaxID=215358 RepID=UPI000F5E90A8|nr:odorant receptor 131-2-like [Larimichthys crocea]
MSYANHSQTNFTIGQQYQELLGLVLFSILSVVPCCIFLFINGTMLFTLRSKTVFCETSRYILLYNLLFADTVLLVQSQLLYILAACRITLTYPVCGVLTMLANLTYVISPMCLERYVAVCYPLRHAAIITIRNTGMAIIVIWAFNSLNVLIQVLLLLIFSFEDLQGLQMKHFCGKESMLLNPMSDIYDKAYTGFVFVSASVAVTCSYIGVIVAARSASTDKASARKARNTLLLHLVQLGLSLSSTIHDPLLFSISQTLDRIIIVRIQIVLYVCIIIFPRCLSSLIYGIRDQTIRPILRDNLCARELMQQKSIAHRLLWACPPCVRLETTGQGSEHIYTNIGEGTEAISPFGEVAALMLDVFVVIFKNRSELLKRTVFGHSLSKLESCELLCKDFFLSSSDDDVSHLRQFIQSMWEVAVVPSSRFTGPFVIPETDGFCFGGHTDEPIIYIEMALDKLDRVLSMFVCAFVDGSP